MIYNVLMGKLNPTHPLTHSLTLSTSVEFLSHKKPTHVTTTSRRRSGRPRDMFDIFGVCGAAPARWVAPPRRYHHRIVKHVNRASAILRPAYHPSRTGGRTDVGW